MSPGFTAIHSLTIHIEPGTELKQSLLKYRQDSPVVCRSDINQHVTSTTDVRVEMIMNEFVLESATQYGLVDLMDMIHIKIQGLEDSLFGEVHEHYSSRGHFTGKFL